MRAEFGYVVQSTGKFKPEYYESYQSSSANVYYRTSVSYLINTTTYYAFIKNMFPEYGTASGSITAFALS